MFTFSGREILIESGVPELKDIAIQLGRIPRWCGATQKFFPVLLHCLVVSDLLPVELKLHGLLHDATELYFSDIPGPAKPQIVKDQENAILPRIYESLGFHFPTPEQRRVVKQADLRSRVGEVHAIGSREQRLLKTFNPRDTEAERAVRTYVAYYDHKDYLEPNGKAVLDFVARVNRASQLV